MMTRRQSQLLDFLVEYQRVNGGVSPSFDEMRAAVLLDQKSSVGRLLTQLEDRGYVRRLAHRQRAIEVLRISPRDETVPVVRSGRRPTPSRGSALFVPVQVGPGDLAFLDFDNAQNIAFPE